MNNKEIMNILLDAGKKGNVKGGAITCGAALSSGKTELIIVAKDAKGGVKTKFGQLAFKYDVEVVVFGFVREFNWIVGKNDVEVIAITDKEVADLLTEEINGMVDQM